MRECIVTVMDLPDIRELTNNQVQKGQSPATKFMLAMHRFASNKLVTLLQEHDNAYVWTDSILLLAYLDNPQNTYERVIKEADRIKAELDKSLAKKGYSRRSFAVAVKGQTFPNSFEVQPRVVFVQASGYAMANCFEIPKLFRFPARDATDSKTHKVSYEWYLDSRIYRKVENSKGISQPQAEREIQLLPKRRKRWVHAYAGYLWPTVNGQ